MGAITSFFGRFFGTETAVKSMIDNVSSGLGKLVYTSQEKAEDEARSITEARSMMIEWIKATSGQNLSRRCLAFLIAGIWAMQYISMQILSHTLVWAPIFIENMTPEVIKAMQSSITLCSESIKDVSNPFGIILTFYFALPYMGNGVAKLKSAITGLKNK